jgi:predicted phage-related endonuclease
MSTSNQIPSTWESEETLATNSAIEYIKQLFRTCDTLTHLNHYITESLQKQTMLEQQLTTTIRTQVDETRLGLELLSTNNSIINNIRTNFKNIDTYCFECKQTLKEYTEIQTVNTG